MEETETIVPEDVYDAIKDLMETGTAHITKPIHVEFVQSFKLPFMTALSIMWRTITRQPIAIIGDMEITRDGIKLFSHLGRLK